MTTPTDPTIFRQHLDGLVARAQAGDKSALSGLADALRQPGVIGTLLRGLEQMAARALVRAVTATETGTQQHLPAEIMLAELERLKDELAPPGSSDVERLLASRVAACWLQVYVDDIACACGRSLNAPTQDLMGRSRDRANKRYLLALRTLATVRRLAAPEVLNPPRPRPARHTARRATARR